ncbi:MAG: CDP-alcohol phosphatidyltransferase family protein [Bacteroidia bacterium]|nr:CDP-alcohol phosphatidyltransferase family protein [Bacteroidia bacterium]
MTVKRHVPNIITLLNVFCGSAAAIFAANSNFIMASIFVFAGIFCDFFDGLVARKLSVQSELGIQLDSLADMITSGLVPGIIMFKLLSLVVNPSDAFINEEWNSYLNWSGINASMLPFLALLIPMSSAYRLAKFNLDEDQQDHFIGLPTPANTLLIISLPLILEFQNNEIMNYIILNKWFLIAIILVSSYLLNSKIDLFALKFKDWSFKSNSVRYIFILLSIIALITLKFAAIPMIVIIYIVMSLLRNLSSN